MDVLNEFSLMYQFSSWLLIKKREFAVVGNEMSVQFSVSVWEQGPPEYKLRARAKTLICEAQVLIWWRHSLPLMLFLSTQIISVNIRTIFFLGALGSWWQAACWWAVTEMSSQLLLGSRGPPRQSVAGQRNLQPWSQGADPQTLGQTRASSLISVTRNSAQRRGRAPELVVELF